MTASHPPDGDAVTPKPAEIFRLFAALADQRISDAELAILEQVLIADRGRRDEFRHWMAMESALSWGIGDRTNEQEFEDRRESLALLNVTSHKPAARLSRVWLRVAAAIAVALCGGSVLFFGLLNRQSHTIAVIADQSADAVWDADAAIQPGYCVPPAPLRLRQGSAQLRFRSGAVVALHSPVEVEVLGPQRIFLRSGRIMPHVPAAAKGFAVVSPSGEILDLGTEFMASVDDDGATEVVVVDGEVEITGGHRKKNAPSRMAQGFATKFTSSDQRISASSRPLLLDHFNEDRRDDHLSVTWKDIDSDMTTVIRDGALWVPFSGRPGRKYPIARVLLEHDLTPMIGRKSVISFKATLPNIGTTPHDRWAGISLDSQSSLPQMAYSETASAAVLVSPDFQSLVLVGGKKVAKSRIFTRSSDTVGPYQVTLLIDDSPTRRHHHNQAVLDVVINGVRVVENQPIDLGSTPRLTLQTNTRGRTGGEGFALFDDICVSTEASGPTDVPHVNLPSHFRGFLGRYCGECHSIDGNAAGPVLDGLSLTLDSVEVAETWNTILGQLNANTMPPDDAPQPTAEELTGFLDVLSTSLASARSRLGDAGGGLPMRRLNRREYRNSVRSLLGINLNVEDLPDDTGTGTYDTAASALFMSSGQFSEYLKLARLAWKEFFARRQTVIQSPAQSHSIQVRIEPEDETTPRVDAAKTRLQAQFDAFARWSAAMDEHADRTMAKDVIEKLRKQANSWRHSHEYYRQVATSAGAPDPRSFGFADRVAAVALADVYHLDYPYLSDYLSLSHSGSGTYLTIFKVNPKETIRFDPTWPVGHYRVRIRAGAVEDTPPQRRFLEVGHPDLHNANGPMDEPGAISILKTFHVTGSIENPRDLELIVDLSLNSPRTLVMKEKRPNDAAEIIWRESLAAGESGPRPAIWIDRIDVEGPLPPAVTYFPAGQIFAHTDHLPEDERAHVILERFATAAFRGLPPDPDFLDRLLGMFHEIRETGESFEQAILEPLSVVLVSPGFLYLTDPDATTLVGAEPKSALGILSDRELAVRLGFFLWAEPPDAVLLDAAQQDALSTPRSLERHVDRMLDDPRSQQFVEGFVSQWLRMSRLDFFRFDTKARHRQFDESTKAAARQEVYETFASLLRENGSLRELLQSKFVVVNGLLASFYGFDGISGDAFRRVSVPADSPRGGLLGMAAILAMGSDGKESSPVERGAWVLRTLLNNPPPPAPPNVPQISRLDGKPLNARERLAAHQEAPQCASCHRRIDPIGYGLENFDAVGAWRTEEINITEEGKEIRWPIDSSGAFYGGPSFGNFQELRMLVAGHDDDFARGFTQALIEYALGRKCGFQDGLLVAEIMDAAREDGFAIRRFIQAFVASPAFRIKER